jgi:phytoene dehydrogenase-like protein
VIRTTPRHREVVTPLDIGRTTGLTVGNIFAGELASQQVLRDLRC